MIRLQKDLAAGMHILIILHLLTFIKTRKPKPNPKKRRLTKMLPMRRRRMMRKKRWCLRKEKEHLKKPKRKTPKKPRRLKTRKR